MKARLLLGALALACSWNTAFAISNRSGEGIDIEAKFLGDTDIQCPFETIPPATASTDEIRWWRAVPKWQPLDVAAYRLDSTDCLIQLELPPGRAVRIFVAGTYTGHESFASTLPRFRVTVTTEHGEIVLSGSELVREFKKRSDLVYELAYRSPEFAR